MPTTTVPAVEETAARAAKVAALVLALDHQLARFDPDLDDLTAAAALELVGDDALEQLAANLGIHPPSETTCKAVRRVYTIRRRNLEQPATDPFAGL